MSKKTVETQVRWAPGGWWPQVLSSDGATWYNITKSPLGALVCTCTGAMYGGTCRHLDAAAELLETVQANDARGLELRDDTYHDKHRVAWRAAHGLVSAPPPEPEPPTNQEPLG